MKQLKNFLIKREQSQACLSFAKREKSRLLAKTLLTLVALLTAATGAWAEETPLLTIESKDYKSFKSGSMTFDEKVTVTFSNSVYNNGNGDGWNAGGAGSLLTVAGTNGYAVTSCKFYTDGGPAATGFTVEGESPSVYLYNSAVYTDDSKSVYKGYAGIKKIEVYGTAPAAASGPDVAWNKAEKTGSFTMPGGNVTLEPEYYPQAALTVAPMAINDVPATTDGAIVKAGTVADIGLTVTAQGTVMYYVSQTALDDDALLALTADQWTADVPTAQSLAQGQAYIYYYVRGNDSDNDEENFSDGDILAANALTVTIAAEPTYAVTFADDTAESDKWTAEPNTGVKKGQTVTVTYSGEKRVKSVKAVKKAAAPSVSDGAINGKFSVSATKQVYFSKGNLRYASGTWSFFDNQYDYYTSYSADAWDKFGWSTSATTYGMNTSESNSDYSGDFVDWGATMGTGWFTLSKDEWTYLFNTRSASTVGGTSNGRYAKAWVNNVYGVILFPDTYTHPEGVANPGGVNVKGANGWDGNSYTVADWTKMESAGCVFLPAAGYRKGTSVSKVGEAGEYWSTTSAGTFAYRVDFVSFILNPETDSFDWTYGLSVRLVCEVTE